MSSLEPGTSLLAVGSTVYSDLCCYYAPREAIELQRLHISDPTFDPRNVVVVPVRGDGRRFLNTGTGTGATAREKFGFGLNLRSHTITASEWEKLAKQNPVFKKYQCRCHIHVRNAGGGVHTDSNYENRVLLLPVYEQMDRSDLEQVYRELLAFCYNLSTRTGTPTNPEDPCLWFLIPAISQAKLATVQAVESCRALSAAWDLLLTKPLDRPTKKPKLPLTEEQRLHLSQNCCLQLYAPGPQQGLYREILANLQRAASN